MRRDRWLCRECGSDELLQTHDPSGEHVDWHKGVTLCAECHSKKHPDRPRRLFFVKGHGSYWRNVTATSLARRVGCHPRTVVRHAKKLGLDHQVIPDDDIDRLLSNILEKGGEKGGDRVLHLVLNLDQEQITKLKHLAIDRDLTVKALVTRLVVEAIDKNKNKKEDKE